MLFPFLYNFFIFASFASYGPYLVLFYQSLGFSGAQIGTLTGLTPLIVLVAAPLWTGLADSRRLHRQVMTLTLLGSAVVLALLPSLGTFLPLLLIIVLIQVFYAPLSSLADSATLHMLGTRRELYGRVRLGGTLGFGAAAAGTGWLVQELGLQTTFWAAGLLVLLALLFSQKFVHAPHQPGEALSARRSLGSLLASPRWLLFLLAAFAGGMGTSATNTFLFPFLDELHAPESLMGLILTVGTLSEIPVLFFGNRLVKRFTPYRLFMLGVSFMGARFLLFALAQTPAWILLLQCFSGLTFVAMWIGGVTYAQENAPPGFAASAQGMFSGMVFGIGAAAGGFTGGLLLESLGGRGLYLVFGLIILGIAALATLLRLRLPATHPL